MNKLQIIILSFFLLTVQTVQAALIQLPRTGQTVSYAAGDDGALQKGVTASPRFTDNNDGTVTDKLTGLVWLKDANAPCFFGTQSWSAALTRVKSIATGTCGLSDNSNAGDWRLPNVVELESLLDLAHFNPALPAGYPFTILPITDNSTIPPTTSLPNIYWTSSSDPLHPSFALTVDILSGIIFRYDKALLPYYIWPVRTSAVTQSQLNTSLSGAGSGTVNSNPAGIACPGACQASFNDGTQVTLMATPSFDSFFSGWNNGGCSGTNNCLVTLNNNTSVNASFNIHPPVNLGAAYYAQIAGAYTDVLAITTLKIRAVTLVESPVFNRAVDIIVKGGFDGAFSVNSGYSTVQGVVTVSTGSVTVENLIIL